MTRNMGTVDRAIRIAVVVVIAALYLMHVISGTLAIILGIVAVVFLVTSFVAFCPGYLPFGISTRGKGPAGAAGA